MLPTELGVGMRKVIWLVALLSMGVFCGCSDSSNSGTNTQNADVGHDATTGGSDVTPGASDTTTAGTDGSGVVSCSYDTEDECTAIADCKWFTTSCPDAPLTGMCIHLDMQPRPPVCP